MSQIQHKVARICKELSLRYGDDWARFINENFSFTGLKCKGLTFQQDDIVNNLTKHKRICVAAGGGIGKSGVAAMLIITFLTLKLFSKCPTTAPSSKLLRDVLWSEIPFWLRRFKYRNLFEISAGRLFVRGYPDWFATARTVPKNADATALNDTLAGLHAKSMLFVVDEASGVPDPVFTAIEGSGTVDEMYVLLISNPVSTGGYYYDTITDPKGRGAAYKVLFYDARESPLVDPSFEANIILRYGKDHPMYTAKVLGLPIDMLTSVVVDPKTYDKTVRENRVYQKGRIILGVDVGGQHDLTVIAHRCGNSFPEWGEYPTSSEPDIVREVLSLWENKYRKPQDFYVVVDALGKGSGVFTSLFEKHLFNVIGFKGSEKSEKPTMYKNKRSEGYFHLHKAFTQLQFPVDPPERLKKELANLKFDYTQGPIGMEDKKKFVARLGFSPDYSDACMMTTVVESNTVSQYSKYVPSAAIMAVTTEEKATKFGRFARFL